MKLPNPVIVVPGITATYLRDEYPLPPEFPWTVLKKDYARASLHPDSLRYEAMQPARILPDQVYEVAYKELVQELRHSLRTREDREVPVFCFGYDWRQPLEVAEQALASFVDEVIERTLLLRHYHSDSAFRASSSVNLVGHSMGGLIVAGYLQRRGSESRVGKVATLASPFQGSFEAVVKITTGTANLGTEPPGSREREAARIMPSLYHLLPSCGGIKVDPGLPADLFEPAVWQTSILDTLEEYVRLHAVSRKNRRQQAQELFAGLLQQARDHRGRLNGLKLEQAGLTAGDWLCVAGVDSRTRVRLVVVEGPDFRFSSDDRLNLWGKGRDDSERLLTGDGTVPLLGAMPTFLGRENLVCVTPEDFGYWEVQDRLLSSASGFHGILPNMDMLHRMIVRHFTGRRDAYGNTWGRPAPGVSPQAWAPPLPLRREADTL